MTALSDLLNEANKEGWSGRRIEAEAKRQGGSIGHAAASTYLRGDHGIPDERILNAFHLVFNIPMKKLRQAAALSQHVTTIDLPEEASRLSPRQWAAVRELIMSMVNPDGRASQPRKNTHGVPTLKEARDAKQQRALEQGQPAAEAAYGDEEDTGPDKPE